MKIFGVQSVVSVQLDKSSEDVQTENMNTEKELERLKAEKARLLRWILIPYFGLFIIRLVLLYLTAQHLIAPSSANLVTVVVCLVALAVALPFVIKLDKVHKQIRKITENSNV